MSESFEQLLNESFQEVEQGSIINGTVVDMDDESITVNVGLKSEGVISKDQFMSAGEIMPVIGDIVKVAMETIDDGSGETRLSREKAKRAETWDMLEERFDSKEAVEGTLNGRVKGGFTVDVNDVRAFLPGSLLDIRPVPDPTVFEGQKLEFQVIKLDQKRNNVVLSRKAILEEAFSEEREELLASLQEGQVKQGMVKNLTEYGAFVDLGGIDGLLHVTDMAWRRIRHPSEMVTVGETIDVKVLSYDRERQRVSLGTKQLGDDPWVQIVQKYPRGTRVLARVTNITDYGCFAELEEGVEGLVHVSEMDWVNHSVIPSKVVTKDDEVEVMILDIDEERRRVSLGIKQCRENPWQLFNEAHRVGEAIRGTIKAITDFGIFVGLPGNVDGLIHVSDLSWNEKNEEVIRHYSKGEEVEARILQIDASKERISLGIKQLQDDTFADFAAANAKNSTVSGTVQEVTAKDAIVSLAPGVDAVLRASEVSHDVVEDVRHHLKVGDEVTAKIINIDQRSHSISLSVKSRLQQDEREAHAEYQRQQDEATKPAETVGDLVKNQLAEGGSEEAVESTTDGEESA
ncbi:MAG: 30S ribosomal protein S1 [Gammaproteobacteria bacterium]|nr:30S ribosomal protein S1 [Gammaproteobacteria bacterium]